MKKKIEELEILEIKEKIKAVEKKYEIEKAERQKKYDILKLERFDSFIKEDGEIEVKYLNDSDYLEYLRYDGVDVERINEPEYRIFLESKGVKFLTEDILNEKESLGFRADKEKELEALKQEIEKEYDILIEIEALKAPTLNLETLVAQKVLERDQIRLENFIKEDGEIELMYLQKDEFNFFKDPVYVDCLRFCHGIDIERINEPEYRMFLESKGVKFITEEETNKRTEAEKLKMEEGLLADDSTMMFNEKDLDLVGDHIEHQND